MNKAVIINSPQEADHFVETFLGSGYLPFSTYPSVDVYLKETYGIECNCISSFVTVRRIIEIEKIASRKVENSLSKLDELLGPSINRQTGLNINYFAPLYSYLGLHQVMAYLGFAEAITELIRQHNVHKIYYYNYTLNKLIHSNTDLERLFAALFPSLETRKIDYKPAPNSPTEKGNLYKQIKKFTSYEKVSGGIKRKIIEARFQKLLPGRKTVILMEPLYDLDFLKTEIKHYNILYYPTLAADRPLGIKMKEGDVSFVKNIPDFETGLQVDNDPITDIFLKDVADDFTENINKYVPSVRLLQELCCTYPVKLAVWGNPPISGIRALRHSYLKSAKITLLGAQHGSCYGDQIRPCHIGSDFDRCDYYVSYGFTNDDLRNIYPDVTIKTTILPFGKAKSVQVAKSARKIDILFPITNSLPFIGSGINRIPSDKLLYIQIELLEYLNTLRDLEIYVKPFPYYTSANYALSPLHKKFENLKFIENVFLTSFLETAVPRITLIEHPASPLYEVMHLDTEIFLMDDPVNPYEKNALRELEKRVHYAESVEIIIEKMDLFLNGKLPKKRDNTFFDHHVQKPDTRRNTLEYVEKLMNRQ